MALKLHHVRREAKVDYLGAAAIVGAVTSLILYLSWAGPDVGWTSTTGIALLVGTVVLIALFVVIERRAAEPIIPLHLFTQWTFTSNIAFAMVMGVAMFGGLIYLPIYLQAVKGMTATESGLAMLPLVLGIFSTSISSGQIMSRTGRYKWMPISGATLVGGALVALSRLRVDTAYRMLAVDHVLLRRRSRSDHAGRRDRGAEQRRAEAHGRGHRLGDLLPLHGRSDRHGAVRRRSSTSGWPTTWPRSCPLRLSPSSARRPRRPTTSPLLRGPP